MENSEQREEEAARRKAGEDATSPGRVFRDAAFAPEMVVIPAGEFLMGSPEDEKNRREHEGPQHRAVIPAPFALGKCAVTFDEFYHFVRENGYGHNAGLGPWPTARDRLELERRGCLLPLAKRGDGARLSAADGSGMGIRLPCRNDNAVPFRRDDQYRSGEL